MKRIKTEISDRNIAYLHSIMAQKKLSMNKVINVILDDYIVMKHSKKDTQELDIKDILLQINQTLHRHGSMINKSIKHSFIASKMTSFNLAHSHSKEIAKECLDVAQKLAVEELKKGGKNGTN